jgi:hypothetical protein
MKNDDYISENFVQNAVCQQINSRFYRRRKHFVDTEVGIKNRKGRADVLLVFPYKNNKAFVVAIEAKSRKTIGSLKFADNYKKRLNIARWGAGLLVVFAGSYFFSKGIELVVDLPLSILFVISVIGGVVILYNLLGKINMRFTQSIPVINQVKRYKANEQWIAIASDTLKGRRSAYLILKREAKKQGVGLIIVNHKGNLRFIHYPKPKYEHIKKDYLCYYSQESSIRRQIGQLRGVYIKTKAERSSIFSMVFIGIILILLMFFLMYMANRPSRYIWQ